MQAAGYQTAVFGKWHLGHGPGHDPTGFDDWAVLPDQGEYHDPEFLTPGGPVVHAGYVTDLITDMSLDWLDHARPRPPFGAHGAITRRPTGTGSRTPSTPPCTKARRFPSRRRSGTTTPSRSGGRNGCAVS